MNDRHNINFSLGLLAGGKSERFGAEKHRSIVDGMTMIEKVYRAAEGLILETLVSIGDKPKVLDLPEYVTVNDEYPGAGPLAGIHACMAAMKTDWLLVLACDLPFVSRSSVQALIAAAEEPVKAVAARASGGETQPLCACYHRSVLWALTSRLDAGKNGVYRFVESLEEVREVDIPPEELVNVNRPEDVLGSNSAAIRK